VVVAARERDRIAPVDTTVTNIELSELIERFARNEEAYRSGVYNETQVRREFIDPFFTLLGWDVSNKQGYAEAYKDVVHEDAIKVGGAHKAPDYSFRIGGTRKFFVEAKKPSLNLKDDISAAYQLRRYAWSAKLPLSILTDFEEFAVYDCRVKPNKTDKPSTARVLYLTYQDYPSRWNDIASIFSRDAILKGSFDKYAEGKKRGTATVDTAFLEEIESWRESIARTLVTRNPSITQRQLNFAVQMTIDRIIFLRMAEDRNIEEYGQLQGFLKGQNVYDRFKALYLKADERYNSGLFHFRQEKDRLELPDDLTPNLHIDDKPLKDIIKSLYYPDSPYEFSVLPVDILGQVYEQFLGKVISLTPGRSQITIDEKPEVRKAGGVYYTPTYIVEYIVAHTLGKLLEGKKPGMRGGGVSKLKIVDPACGSGSFLIGAYQYLLNWHRDRYVDDDPKKHSKELYQGSDGQWLLTTQEKKRILLNNIYGVDIDPQAVEVTKLSLLLKVLEGESQQTLYTQLRMFQERALPDLDDNIKCGNSLISPDFYDNRQFRMFDDEYYRVNVFDWKKAWPSIFSGDNPGFDAVIGNPPYGAYLYEPDKAYLRAKFIHQGYQLDSYLLFMEQSVKYLLSRGGFYGMIIPNPWLTNILQDSMRRFIVDKTIINEIVHFQFPVFPKVTVDTEVVILQNTTPKNDQALITIVRSLDASRQISEAIGVEHIYHEQQKWRNLDGSGINIFTSPSDEALALKCFQKGVPLEVLCAINVGIKPYQVGKGIPRQTREIVTKRLYDSDTKVDDSFRPYLRGKDIGRYKLIPLKPRYLKYGPWLAEPRPAADFNAPVKILMRQTGDSLVATIDTNRYLCLNNMHVLVPRQSGLSPFYILGIINSKLLNWYYHTLNPELGEALAEVKRTNVAKLPICTINSSNHIDQSNHDRMVDLVERMLELQQRVGEARMSHEKTVLQRQIDATDKEIDRLVYKLYGLSETEIVVVEPQK